MKNQDFNAIIREAVKNKQTLEFEVRYGIGNDFLKIELDTYIFGADIYQYDFVWGYLPDEQKYYKLMLEFIYSINQTHKNFIVQNDALYLYASEEEHWSRVDDEENENLKVYGQGLVDRINR
jgi:hypothetical protein